MNCGPVYDSIVRQFSMARQDEKQALVISARTLQNFRPNATKNCPNPKANPKFVKK